MEQSDDVSQKRADYIVAMIERFTHDNPGIAELLALDDDATRHYANATIAYHDPVIRTSSSHSMTAG